jgi:hypothetical protein
MVGHHDIWRTEPGGVLAAHDSRGFRLTVAGPAISGGEAQFAVSRRDVGGDEQVIGSGTAHTVRQAMQAARQLADGLATELARL